MYVWSVVKSKVGEHSAAKDALKRKISELMKRDEGKAACASAFFRILLEVVINGEDSRQPQRVNG